MKPNDQLTVWTGRTSLTDVGFRLLLKWSATASDVRDHPLITMIFDLLSLLVSRMFVAEHPPPIVQLLKVALIASQFEYALVFEASRLLVYIS